MSIKDPIAHGENFYLYKECFSDDFVYLELEGCGFEASNNKVKVEIPIEVWEFIRSMDTLSFEHANLSDIQIESLVSDMVDEYTAKQGNDSKRSLLPAYFGNSDASRKELIKRGVDHFKKLRDRERAIQDMIQEFKRRHYANQHNADLH
ncbi:hypothetical protein [Pelagicoccus sp. SDUM812002]|uniref:hypothetical protein n=1 Tax=Pelagicoccus sp. SDUM812002 TaxID=3041266 RepID=UPI00280E5F3F|nr:hypothetical protein [Pelagicoccus sp. SDUM812002]MDQ8183949.1 hypothetical protein [Pelagicoccus sp. SDUM812002]